MPWRCARCRPSSTRFWNRRSGTTPRCYRGNPCSAPVLMAKLMFSGMLPVALTNFSAFSFAATTPTTSPLDGQQRPATVARLNRGADLQEAGVVQDAAERTYYPGRDREVGCEQSVKRIADRHNAVAGSNRLVLDDGDILERAGGLKQGKVIGFIAGNDAQRDRRFSGQAALDVADTTVDDVLIGDEVTAGADQKTRPGLSAGFFRLGRRGARRAPLRPPALPPQAQRKNPRRRRHRIASPWPRNSPASATIARSDRA